MGRRVDSPRLERPWSRTRGWFGEADSTRVSGKKPAVTQRSCAPPFLRLYAPYVLTPRVEARAASIVTLDGDELKTWRSAAGATQRSIPFWGFLQRKTRLREEILPH